MPEAVSGPRLSTMQWVGAGVVVVLIAFLAGFVPQWLIAGELRHEKARVEARVDGYETLAILGMAGYEANRNNFASAAESATRFFDRLQRVAGATSDVDARQKLKELETRRDEITANLAAADPAVKQKLADMYAALFAVMMKSVPRSR